MVDGQGGGDGLLSGAAEQGNDLVGRAMGDLVADPVAGLW